MTIMNFPLTVADRIDELTAARSLLRERLAGKYQRDPDHAGTNWSPAEIAFHLHLSEKNIWALLSRILANGARHERKNEDHLRGEWEHVRKLIGVQSVPVKSPSPV